LAAQAIQVRTILEEQRDPPGLDRIAARGRIAAILTSEQRQQLEGPGVNSRGKT
jgi:hypothetical protein